MFATPKKTEEVTEIMPVRHSSVYHGMFLWYCPLISVPVKVFHIFLLAHI